MTQLNVYLPEGLFIAALLFAMAALLYTFGAEIIKDARGKGELLQNSVTSTEVGRYFIDRGYVVCNITPVKNTNKWLVFLIRNGEYEVVTAFTNGNCIEGHTSSVA